MSATLASAWRTALDVVFPPTCLACRAAVASTGALCGACWGAIRFIERPFCERLGLPFEHEMGEGVLSAQALAHPPVFGRARAAALYEEGPSSQLVHRLKYSDRMDLAKPMAAWMTRAGGELLAEADALAPIPLHVTRLWRRQFNQSAELARAVARASGVRLELNLIQRHRRTRSQVGLTRPQRAENLADAFRCPAPAKVEGRRIVLIDDVLTSGATANAAAGALLAAGARGVDVLVFARVAK